MAQCTVVDQNVVPKLLEVISLLLERKQTRSRVVCDAYTLYTSILKKSFCLGKESSSLINECLLNHRFEDAAKFLWIMWQDRSCFDLFLFKGIMIVLENLMPSNVNEMVKKVSNTAKGLRYIRKHDVQLEYLIYALKNNIDDLQNYSKAFDKHRTGFKSIPLLENIFSAYCALLSYLKWVDISQTESISVDSKDLAMPVVSSFKKLIDQPGNWDIFVLKIIEMLEYYKEYDDLEEILKKYVECNPEHVNAYIYLCVHLHKHKAGSNGFIHYAKALTDLCPSDERVLLLVQTWKKLGKKLKKRLKILFYFLDYAANRTHILGWRMLSSHLHEAVFGGESDYIDAIKSFWSIRCHSWNYVHFLWSTTYSKDETLMLLFHKVQVLAILEPNHEFIRKAEMRFPEINELKSTYDVISSETESCKSLYDVDR